MNESVTPTRAGDDDAGQRGTVAPQKVAVSIAEGAQLLGIGRTTLLGLVDAGSLPSRKIGRRRLLLVRDIEAFAASLPVATGADR